MRIWIGGALAFLAVLPGRPAQGADLASKPPQVHVEVRGRVSLAGVTPLPLDDLPPGDYRLEAQGLGTAFARGRLVRGANTVRVDPTAGPSALLWPPGIIHIGLRERGRGLLLLTGAGAGGTMAVINEVSRSDAAEDVRRFQEIYDQAVTEEDIVAARLNLEHAQDEANDEAQMRNLWAIYAGTIWVGAAVEQWLLTPQASLAKNELTLGVPSAGKASAGLRSLVFPGSGQRFLGHSTRASIFSFGVMSMGAVTLIAHESYLSARRDQSNAQRHYDAASSEEDLNRWRAELQNAADKTDSRNSTQWAMVGVTAGIYVWNVLDAWWLGGRVGSVAPIGMSVLPAPSGFQATLTWRIS
jgi:hypothetical protein